MEIVAFQTAKPLEIAIPSLVNAYNVLMPVALVTQTQIAILVAVVEQLLDRQVSVVV